MTKHLNRKIFCILMVAILVSFALLGCSNTKVEPNDLILKSIDKMKALDSYTSMVYVKFNTDEQSGGHLAMDALIDLHKEPFAYSNVQEISTGESTPDNPFSKLVLRILLKDQTVYTHNSVTGLWIDQSEESLVQEITANGDIFQNYDAAQFTDLEVASVNKNKVTIKGKATNSVFLKSLLSSFETEILGNVEMIIDLETEYLESFVYYPEIDGTSTENNKITIKTSNFNAAPEVEIPEDAVFE